MEQESMKPCPFCGGEAMLFDAVGEMWACCKTCLASSHMHSDPIKAAAAWNARAAVTDEQFSLAVHDGRVWQVVRECRMRPARGGGWYCSECSVWVAPGPMANATEYLAPRYCPNCGAKVVV